MARSRLCCFGVSQTLVALPDQDSFYDVTDCLEQQGMESIMQQHMNSKGTDPDLKQQFAIYEVSCVASCSAGPNPHHVLFLRVLLFLML